MTRLVAVARLARRHVPIVAAFLLGLSDVILTADTPDLGHLIPLVVAWCVEWFTSPASRVGRPTL